MNQIQSLKEFYQLKIMIIMFKNSLMIDFQNMNYLSQLKKLKKMNKQNLMKRNGELAFKKPITDIKEVIINGEVYRKYDRLYLYFQFE